MATDGHGSSVTAPGVTAPGRARRPGARPDGAAPDPGGDSGSGAGGARSGDPRPIAGYSVLMGVYAVLVGVLVYALRARRRQVRAFTVRDLLVMGLATQHLSRLVTKDNVLAPVRKPFTRFVEPAGEGESNEDVAGHGIRHAVGELVSCPFCAGQWVATALVAGTIAAPAATQAGMSVLAVAQISDYLQLAYGALRKLD